MVTASLFLAPKQNGLQKSPGGFRKGPSHYRKYFNVREDINTANQGPDLSFSLCASSRFIHLLTLLAGLTPVTVPPTPSPFALNTRARPLVAFYLDFLK